MSNINLSPISLEKLDSLAFAVQKYLYLTADCSSLAGVQALLRMAAAEQDQNIVVRYADFISSLSDAEKDSLDFDRLSHITQIMSADKQEAHISHKTYRGIIFDEETSESQESYILEPQPASSVVVISPSDTIKGGVEEVEKHEARKINKIYRGQPIYDDD